MGIEGPSNTKTAEKKAKTKATDAQVEAQNSSTDSPMVDTTSVIGDKNIIGLQGNDGSDTEYKPDEDKQFVR